MNDQDRRYNATRLLEQLQRSQAFHQDGVAGVEQEFSRLRRWQSVRLARTHADLLHNPRYQPAAEFFLEELYGDRDFRQREHDLARIVPMMNHILPAGVLHTAALALELNALSYELDAEMTRMLIANCFFRGELDEAAYVAAYRRCARYELRHHQIDLIEQLGQDLEKIVRKHFIHTALKLAKTPARLAGVGELHHFLDAGFHAFRHMGTDAGTFVATITHRERVIMERMYAGHPQPLTLEEEMRG
ncbi:MAG TPA: hypothetical protein P5102_01200 [Candidatus Competibacteraceae bacterium]|nr:hypothetical protein [Candidatus Competibacteraceae bacterium]HRZ04761.1 hypothetical protein [Candidatus Competibacteraceae bacterium]HSA47010.1 hypothetical protein [Candidatus Competibacteraceae bacterium]